MSEMQRSGQLNDAQQRRLSITCQYIDKLLADVEQILHEAESKSPFPRHAVNVTLAQTRVLEDYIRRVREQLLRALAWQGLRPEPPHIPATRAILSLLAFVDIAIEELKPSYMRGSGAVAENATDELNGVVHELRSVVQGMERHIRQEYGADLQSRLQQLEKVGHDVRLIQKIEEIVTRHGLVEFRPRIASLASRLAENNLEVALFGRVNSGKSSLLNALLSADVLPVGVNPITAVPTRLRYGSELRATVAFGSGRDEIVAIGDFRKLITEEGNPGNQRNVVRAVVEVPSTRLRQGIVLVDTPGLGSLARRGAAETIAYLPSSDLALMLIDAGAALNEEDLGTLRLLYEAGIPALLLLSKADLLSNEDLQRVAGYIERQVERELGGKVEVHPVSSLPEHTALLDRFFEGELLPRFEQAQTLRKASVARKVGALRQSVATALETSLDHVRRGRTDFANEIGDGIEEQLRHVSGQIGEQQSHLDREIVELAERPDAVIQSLSDGLIAQIYSGRTDNILPAELSELIREIVQSKVDHLLANVHSTVKAAIETLRQVGAQMGRSDVPSREDAETIIRNVPGFEFDGLRAPIYPGHWRWLGRKIAGAGMKRSLRHSIEPVFEVELHRYGQALRLWGEQMSGKLVMMVNSYADAYRAQLNRVSGEGGPGEAPEKIERDLETLTKWNATETHHEIQQSA